METLFKEKAKSIAVAVDGSDPSWEAFSRAVNMAKLLHLELDVLFVVQLQKMGYFAFIDRHLKEDKEAAAKIIFDEAKRRTSQYRYSRAFSPAGGGRRPGLCDC